MGAGWRVWKDGLVLQRNGYGYKINSAPAGDNPGVKCMQARFLRNVRIWSEFCERNCGRTTMYWGENGSHTRRFRVVRTTQFCNLTYFSKLCALNWDWEGYLRIGNTLDFLLKWLLFQILRWYLQVIIMFKIIRTSNNDILKLNIIIYDFSSAFGSTRVIGLRLTCKQCVHILHLVVRSMH